MTREEAIEIFEDNDTVIENPNYLFTEIGEAWDMAIEALKEERPHVEWIKVKFRTREEKLFYGDAYRCSHCKVISDTHGSAHYCENCGADMKKGE